MGCEAPWWCAVGASVGSCKIDPPVAQRIAATWDQERARRAMGRCMGEDAGEGRMGTSVAAHSHADPFSWSSCYWKATSNLSVSMRRRLPRYETS